MSGALLPSQSGSQPGRLRPGRRKIEGLRFALVRFVVHDGRVPLLGRTVKTRLNAGDRALAAE